MAVWDLFEELADVEREMDDLFERFFERRTIGIGRAPTRARDRWAPVWRGRPTVWGENLKRLEKDLRKLSAVGNAAGRNEFMNESVTEGPGYYCKERVYAAFWGVAQRRARPGGGEVRGEGASRVDFSKAEDVPFEEVD